MKSFFCVVLLLGLACVSCGAQFLGNARPGSHVSDPADEALLQNLLQASRPPVVFRPDDVLSVQVYGLKDYAMQQRVPGDGYVNFPLVGKVQVSGLTVEQLEDRLHELLAGRGMVRDPQVTVIAVSQPSNVVTVSGAVGKPGVFPAYGNLTIIDYLSEAEGLIETLPPNGIINSPASPVVTLIRPSLAGPVTIPLGPNPRSSPYARIPLFPGDEIRVGHVGVVYAVGALKNQGVFPLKSSTPTTVLQLLALAGGIGFQAEEKSAYIVRTQGDAKYILDLDISKIRRGKMADVALQPDDVLLVPTNQMRAAIKGGGAGILVAFASAAIYRY